MISIPERPEDFPGQQRVAWRREPHRIVLAAILGALWPPLIVTLPLWPPKNWVPGLEIDWRLLVLFIGLLAVPGGLWLLDRERRRSGLLAAALGAVFAVVQSVLQWFSAASVGEAVGGSETSLLIYGVGGLSIAVLVGVSYALWAGLCAAFIAFRLQPQVRDRLGVMGDRDPD